MTYWTVLVLTVFINGQEMQSRLFMLRSTLETAWRNVRRATSLAWAYLLAKDQSQGQLGLIKVRCNETKRICTSG
jgi:hypothetical protein